MTRIVPEKSNKITIRAIAAGSSAFTALLQLPQAKGILDVVYYGQRLDLYTPITIVVFLIAIASGIITGGTYLTNFKGNVRP